MMTMMIIIIIIIIHIYHDYYDDYDDHASVPWGLPCEHLLLDPLIGEETRQLIGAWDGSFKKWPNAWVFWRFATHRFLLECGECARLQGCALGNWWKLGMSDNLLSVLHYFFSQIADIPKLWNIQNWANWRPLVPWNPNVVSWHIESKCWNPTRHKNSDLSDLSIWKNINVTTSLFPLVQIQTWSSWQTYWYWFHLIFEEVSQWTFLNKWESGECSARGWWGSGSKYTDSCHPYLTGQIVACFLP